MLKKTIVYILISCLSFSAAFAEVAYAVAPGSFAVKVDYIYSDGNRMIISWNEGKEKHTLYPVTEGGNPINLLTYYKAGKLYPASSPTTQMRVFDENGNTHLFNIDTNTGAGQAAPQAAPQSTPKEGQVAAPETPEFVWWLFWGVMGVMIVGGITSAGRE